MHVLSVHVFVCMCASVCVCMYVSVCVCECVCVCASVVSMRVTDACTGSHLDHNRSAAGVDAQVL